MKRYLIIQIEANEFSARLSAFKQLDTLAELIHEFKVLDDLDTFDKIIVFEYKEGKLEELTKEAENLIKAAQNDHFYRAKVKTAIKLYREAKAKLKDLTKDSCTPLSIHSDNKVIFKALADGYQSVDYQRNCLQKALQSLDTNRFNCIKLRHLK